MYRIFGTKKPEAPAPPPPDVQAFTNNLNNKVPELDNKINQLNTQLLNIKKQLATCRNPSQQNNLKQQAMTLLKRRQMYEQQRNSYQTRSFNMEQVNFAIGTIKDAQEQYEIQKYMNSVMKNESSKVSRIFVCSDLGLKIS